MDVSLARAIVLWRRGDPVPVDLLFKLANEGHDVAALEAQYTP